ncbi:MAG TPA: sugar transferase [Verrucomicrobiales bacterium]|nr:sugar transferase [Verrucomicrobiales bacterium]
MAAFNPSKLPLWTRWGRYPAVPEGRIPRSKRCFDLILLLAAAPLWLPLLAITAVVVRCSIGRPVLFSQQRPGLGARLFLLRKFRTMTNACDATGQLLPDSERLTAAGRWLRASSLDELPGLLSVLRGEISLVGPRPLLPAYLPLYTPDQARRHQVLPGITGWAQVNGRNRIPWEEKFEMDVWYVDHASLGLDLYIIMRTLLKVLRREGISADGQATMPVFAGTPENALSRRP